MILMTYGSFHHGRRRWKVRVGARIKNEIIAVGEIENYERMRVKMKISIRMTIKMKTRMKITIKVPISCLGILHICNLWDTFDKNFIFVDFCAFKGNRSDGNPGICVIVKTRSF